MSDPSPTLPAQANDPKKDDGNNVPEFPDQRPFRPGRPAKPSPGRDVDPDIPDKPGPPLSDPESPHG